MQSYSPSMPPSDGGNMDAELASLSKLVRSFQVRYHHSPPVDFVKHFPLALPPKTHHSHQNLIRRCGMPRMRGRDYGTKRLCSKFEARGRISHPEKREIISYWTTVCLCNSNCIAVGNLSASRDTKYWQGSSPDGGYDYGAP